MRALPEYPSLVFSKIQSRISWALPCPLVLIELRWLAPVGTPDDGDDLYHCLNAALRGTTGCRGLAFSSSFVLPELKRDYPLNLSISVSGGKETNKDSASNGE